jgi:hypothetical protein
MDTSRGRYTSNNREDSTMALQHYRVGQTVLDVYPGNECGGTIKLTKCLHLSGEYHGIKNGHMYVIRRRDEIAPLPRKRKDTNPA